MAKKPCDCDSGKMTFEQWAAAGGAVPLSYKGREKAWANQVRKYAAGGEVKMADGGDPSKPYIGYRRAGRRPESQQDREASANIPVAVARGLVSGSLGMPADLLNLPGAIYSGITGKESYELPFGSEYIEKRLPFRGASQTPVGQMFTGASQLAGGAYTGPGSGARAAMAVPKAVMKAGRDFVQAAGQPAVNVIKPKGGNFLTGSVEKAVEPLKKRGLTQAQAAEMAARPTPIMMAREGVLSKSDEALNQWIDRNLTNYIKKEMATPEDPVRRLAEQGILHIEPQGGAVRAHAHRDIAGMPVDPTATSPLARAWEDVSDAAVVNSPYRDYLQFGESMDEGLRRVGGEFAVRNPDVRAYAIDDVGTTASNLGFDHIVDVLKQDLAAGRIRPEQLSKVSMEQAVRRTYDFDQDMAKKMREAQIKATEGMPVHKEYPEGYRWIELAAPKAELQPGHVMGKPSGYPGLHAVIDEATGQSVSVGATPNEALRLYKRKEREGVLENALKYEGDTMGHCVGGYCPDVLEGRSRIYSLRDAKGEPHVTVEVAPRMPGWPDAKQAGGDPLAITQEAKRRMGITPENEKDLVKNANGDERQRLQKELDKHFADIYKEQFGEFPSEIVQIKGKQNRAPKEEYLPFVQDFVRSGQWSEVGDFKNTGLIRKSDLIDKFGPDELDAIGKGEYLTKGEYDDLLLKALKPEEGMKRGGEVKMQAGGIAKILKKLVGPSAEAAAKEASAAERAAAGRMAADVTKATQPMKMSEALGNLNVEGKGKLKVTQSDRTRVGGGNIGGAMFPGLSQVDPLYEGLVWGVGKKPTASSLINQSDDLTYWSTLLGAEDQLKTNPLVFNKLRKGFVDAMKQGKLSPELEEKINKNLALTFGEGAEIRDPKIWQKANTFDKRAALADVILGQGIPPGKGGVALGGEKSGKGVIFKPTDILKRETEPLLLHPEHGGDVPTFGVGPRLFQFSGGIKVRPDLHPGFPVLLEGQDMGMVFKPAPGEIAMRDFANRMLTERGRKPGYYEWTMGESGKGLPSQLITDEYLTYLQKAGYKKGGKVGGLSQAKNQRKK